MQCKCSVACFSATDYDADRHDGYVYKNAPRFRKISRAKGVSPVKPRRPLGVRKGARRWPNPLRDSVIEADGGQRAGRVRGGVAALPCQLLLWFSLNAGRWAIRRLDDGATEKREGREANRAG